MKIGYLVSANYEEVLRKCPQFLNEHEYLAPVFQDLGAELIAVNWRDPKIDWKRYDLLLPKAVWDYFDHGAEFEAFLNRVNLLGVRMINSIDAVLWNMRKTYLQDLLARGLPVGEFTIIPQGSPVQAALELRKYSGAPTLVAKPSISGGGKNTIRCAPEALNQHTALLQTILSTSDLILQPFFPEIEQTGEFSYFFFGGEFSHAIHKIPAPGDYRAHQLFGGTNHPIFPTSGEIAQAWSFVRGSGFQCPYARVDAFKRDGLLHLVELELIEPHLYFENADQGAGSRFCRAVLG